MTYTELQKKITHLEIELTRVKEIAEAMKKRDDGGVFKPQDGPKYWYVSGSGEVYTDQWSNCPINHDHHSIGNCFPTEQSAEDAVRALKLTQKARESQDGFVPDWEKLTQNKFFVCLDKGLICVASHLSWNQAPIFGFWEDESECDRFIDENYEDLSWFFTEYRR